MVNISITHAVAYNAPLVAFDVYRIDHNATAAGGGGPGGSEFRNLHAPISGNWKLTSKADARRQN